MKLWIIDKLLDPNRIEIPSEDLVINFTSQEINHAGLLDLSAGYNSFRETIKDKYIKFVADLGNMQIRGTAIKQYFTLEGASLWWFNKITKKDTFNDSLFDDICKAILAKKIIEEKSIGSVVVLSESKLLNYLWSNKKERIMLFIIRCLLVRIKTLLNFIHIKFVLLLRHKSDKRDASCLFFSFYPVNWNKDLSGDCSDRFFRALPLTLEGSGYLMYMNRIGGNVNAIKTPLFPIQKYLKLFDLLRYFCNLGNLVKYILVRRNILQHFFFEGIDLRLVYDLYLWEAVSFKDYYYSLIVKGTERICKKIRPRCIVSGGEFGLIQRAVVVGAKRGNVTNIWLQHAVISKLKLWYFNDFLEIFDGQGKINQNFYQYMPVADRFIVWGEKSNELLKKYGYPQERMIKLGNPRYDFYAQLKIDNNGTSKDNIVLTPTIDKEELLIFAVLARAIKQSLPSRVVVLKLHPRYRELLDEAVLEMFSSLAQEGVVIDTERIEKYYNHLTVFICGVSTAGIEAAYFGAKVITYLPRYHNRFTPEWLEKGTYAHSVGEVIKMIKDNQNIPLLNWSKYYLPPGNASKRVLEFLEGKTG